MTERYREKNNEKPGKERRNQAGLIRRGVSTKNINREGNWILKKPLLEVKKGRGRATSKNARVLFQDRGKTNIEVLLRLREGRPSPKLALQKGSTTLKRMTGQT